MCMCISKCVCVCVCVSERKVVKERESELGCVLSYICVCVCECFWGGGVDNSVSSGVCECGCQCDSYLSSGNHHQVKFLEHCHLANKRIRLLKHIKITTDNTTTKHTSVNNTFLCV